MTFTARTSTTETTTTIHLAAGMKRIINIWGRDVIIFREKGRWTMAANCNQPDSRTILGKYPTVAACEAAIKEQA